MMVGPKKMRNVVVDWCKEKMEKIEKKIVVAVLHTFSHSILSLFAFLYVRVARWLLCPPQAVPSRPGWWRTPPCCILWQLAVRLALVGKIGSLGWRSVIHAYTDCPVCFIIFWYFIPLSVSINFNILWKKLNLNLESWINCDTPS